ncbi:hypothetical protein HanIR_Chr05g0219371 [Helianthus annuus]|nr:hypothetical protein HanIR_Chr05g0219371 [Helianthus annuus]
MQLSFSSISLVGARTGRHSRRSAALYHRKHHRGNRRSKMHRQRDGVNDFKRDEGFKF